MKHYLNSFKGFVLLIILLTTAPITALAQTTFNPSSFPYAGGGGVSGNLALALSVEYPTARQASYVTTNYNSALKYEGYFDNRKCYTYNTTNEVFGPTSAPNGSGKCGNTEWHGNFLNWLTMANLDQFRSVMTGGTRDNFSSISSSSPGDTTTITILIRASSDGNSQNPVKNITATDPTPLKAAKQVRSGGYGSKFVVKDSSTNFPNLDIKASCAASASKLAAGQQCFHIRVEVCKTVGSGSNTIGPEANCISKYSGIAKPEGLLQKYSERMRYAALGYLNDSTTTREGAVLRAPMKSIGVNKLTNSGVTTNPNKEWDSITGIIYINPDPTDAANSSVTNSGVINYINKFGYESGYKTFDPVSELYYATLLYMRGLSFPNEYTSGLTQAMKDNFPVIPVTAASTFVGTGSRSAILNSCQKNFILGIGDIYTHCDGNLPGSSNTSCSNFKPVDNSINVDGLWKNITGMENTTITAWVGGANQGTPYIASLAYWAHVNDIRSDLSGTQTISTFWVDVLENGNGVSGMPAAGQLKTQYWYATKYGGFDTSITNNPNTNAASWSTVTAGQPDNWFAGSNPVDMRSGLTSAFAKMQTEINSGSASSVALSSTGLKNDLKKFAAGYDGKTWSGSLIACLANQEIEDCRLNSLWDATKWFDLSNTTATYTINASSFTYTPKLTSSTRKIITSWSSTSTAFSSMAFQTKTFNVSQTAIIKGSDNKLSERTAYLRGDRSNEGNLFRTRSNNLLGDIVNSNVTHLSGAGPRVNVKLPTVAEQIAYSQYRNNNITRASVVYVGANDGMLHAFDGSNGRELFGYIPGTLFNKLPELSNPNYTHQFYVDSTPMVGDYQKTTTTWTALLVGGLGAGGKGYYALDISDQQNFASTTETQLAQNLPKWEFTTVHDGDLGYTYNEPSQDPSTYGFKQLAKVADPNNKDGVWRVIVGNGFGSANGKAALYFLNPSGLSATKFVEAKLVADNGPSNGLATPTPMDTDGDGLTDTIYAGDLKGNMHKFQYVDSDKKLVTPSSTKIGSWQYIGILYDSKEPITTAPSVYPVCDGSTTGWNISFGTGKLIEDGDSTDTSARGFYSVVDTGVNASLTVTASDLINITYTTTGTTRSFTAPSMTSKRGWKMVFTGGERVLGNSSVPPDTGVVLFATTAPSAVASANTCSSTGLGFVMAVNLCTRGHGLVGDLGGYSVATTGVLKVIGGPSEKDNQAGIYCNQSNCNSIGGGRPGILKTTAPAGRYSWREILTK